MTAAQPSVSMQRQLESRWPVLLCVTAGVLVFFLLQQTHVFSRTGYLALNDISWGVASLLATSIFALAAYRTASRERTAWFVLAAACAIWFIGQVAWTYYDLVVGKLPGFPNWTQALFAAYDWLFVAGLLLLPRPEASGFTPRHAGNLLLIICVLGVIGIVAFVEPAQLPDQLFASTIVAIFHCAGLAAMFVAALYLLWSYHWQRLYWPLVLLVVGTGLHAGTYIAYLHQMMTGSYTAAEWYNISWLFVFGAYACAAYERIWQIRSDPPPQLALMRRERWLDALVPALLITIMLGMAWGYRHWLSVRTAEWATWVALLFAAVLGLRELWVQRQEQRLWATLHEANEQMRSANLNLSESEARYRTLSSELEHRVAERTAALEQANRDLESFAYAVAHDLKSPLRSIEGFGALLSETQGPRLDEQGKGYVNRMRRGALKMTKLIDDLLAYARVDRQEFRMSDVSVLTLIERVVAEQHDNIERHGVELHLLVPPLHVHADSNGLLIACRNLVENAIKFSRAAHPPRISIRAERDTNAVRIAIQDNGIGFDMTHHDRIFDMFQRLHRDDEFPGTGIGLAIVRKAVMRMGGNVTAQSKTGAGATFYISLPIVEEATQELVT
jgi:signal transduction histidine kinase